MTVILKQEAVPKTQTSQACIGVTIIRLEKTRLWKKDLPTFSVETHILLRQLEMTQA